MNNCVRTNLFSTFDCIWLLEWLPQVSAQREHTIVLYNTGDKECVMATRVPNPISFYYTSNESLLNKLSGSIKYVLMYTRTHLTRSEESFVFRCGGIKAA